MKSWLKKLVAHLTKKQNALVLLRLGVNRRSEVAPQSSGSSVIPACPFCGVVPINWVLHKKWCRFVTETKSSETVLVGTDAVAMRVPIDRRAQRRCIEPIQSAIEKARGEESPNKESFLPYLHLCREPTPEARGEGSHVPSRPRKNSDEREMEHTAEAPSVSQGVPEIHCTNCDTTRAHLAVRGDVGPCCGEPFWTVPYELIWRSLPRGEDR